MRINISFEARRELRHGHPLSVQMSEGGGVTIEQDGAQISLSPGEWAFVVRAVERLRAAHQWAEVAQAPKALSETHDAD